MNNITRFEIIRPVSEADCEACSGTGIVLIATHKPLECPACHGEGRVATGGREVIFNQHSGLEAEVSMQDDGRTLKVFIKTQEGK